MLTEFAERAIITALRQGRIMRNAQKEYFKTRTQSALTQSKIEENNFDMLLDDAAYAVKYGTPRPKQQELL